ncbi:MAG: TPM domain-containing protein [Verrucomicrobia bacterium]|nr:TPM domain-containing protein [Verrucomicrobiota bacterium]
MKCPRCVQELHNGIGQCPHCGFSLAYLDAQFGEDAVVLERLTDAVDCIQPEMQQRIEDALDQFEKQFPQLFIAIYAGALPELTDIRQFAFWLLNRATVPSLDNSRPNENGALFVLDLNSMSVSMTLGYFIEPYFSDHELLTLLRQGHPDLQSGDYGSALLGILGNFSKLLKGKSKAARKGQYGGSSSNSSASAVHRSSADQTQFTGKALNRETTAQTL